MEEPDRCQGALVWRFCWTTAKRITQYLRLLLLEDTPSLVVGLATGFSLLFKDTDTRTPYFDTLTPYPSASSGHQSLPFG